MAFMMPVVKKEYDIYVANKSPRRSSSISIPRSRTSTLCDSNAPSLSCSPGSDIETLVEERMRSVSELPPRSRNISQCSCDSESPSPKTVSRLSQHLFHSRVADKLKKTFRMKDNLAVSSSTHEQDSNSESKTMVQSS